LQFKFQQKIIFLIIIYYSIFKEYFLTKIEEKQIQQLILISNFMNAKHSIILHQKLQVILFIKVISFIKDHLLQFYSLYFLTKDLNIFINLYLLYCKLMVNYIKFFLIFFGVFFNFGYLIFFN